MSAGVPNLVSQGAQNTLNISVATVVKAAPGTVLGWSVIVAGTNPGAIYDSTSTSGNTAADQVATIPIGVATTFQVSIPCLKGITVVPPSGAGVLAIWWM